MLRPQPSFSNTWIWAWQGSTSPPAGHDGMERATPIRSSWVTLRTGALPNAEPQVKKSLMSRVRRIGLDVHAEPIPLASACGGNTASASLKTSVREIRAETGLSQFKRGYGRPRLANWPRLAPPRSLTTSRDAAALSRRRPAGQFAQRDLQGGGLDSDGALTANEATAQPKQKAP